MNKLIAFGLTLIFMSGCASIKAPPEFVYSEIPTDSFTIALWQKKSSSQAPYKVYIEGDGRAFNSNGLPTSDPTPKGEMIRELAYGDTSPNVIYLARPCQYIQSASCMQKYWTTARFAPIVIQAEYQAIKKIVGNSPVILIGFSGGAQIAELLAATTDLNVKKIITIAGNLDHTAWANYHNLLPLKDSLNAADYRSKLATIPQTHYIGSKDNVIPPRLAYRLADKTQIIEVQGASHNTGWDKIYPTIHSEQ